MLILVKKLGTDFCNRLTEDTNTKVDRVKDFGGPISMFDFNAKAMFPSFKQRLHNSAHSYSGLQIANKVPIHDVERNPSTPSPDDSLATMIT